MKEFMNDDFLLESDTAKKLYHDYASKMPIIDYHCHINPREIAEDKKYENITQVWLYGDHYKWRAMRSCGVEEKYITGNASDYEKFEKWAEILPRLIGNPLYHWTHIELKKYFRYKGTLNKRSAKEVWETCNDILENLSARKIIEDSDVEVICTTDDPIDELIYHKQIAEDGSFSTKVLPTFRPDKAINIDSEYFSEYMIKLSDASDIDINSYDLLKKTLVDRIDYFHKVGCRISDHALEYVMCEYASDDEIEEIFNKGLVGDKIEANQVAKFKTALLIFLAGEYSKRGWAMQIHYGTIRNVNSKMFLRLGPDTGFDAISTTDSSYGLSKLFDEINKQKNMPKTIVYSLNPNDNALIGTIIGCFQESGIRNKIQHGSAWWFNDTKLGMVKQIESLANLSALGNFVGMLTDSRSFLSYTRHEYFRRILCNLIGSWVENGEYPNDDYCLKQIVCDISYNNTKDYFGF